MEELKKEKKPREARLDRILLRADSVERLGSWIKDLEARLKGIRISRSDLVNWVIGEHTPDLSASEIRAIQGRFYDDVHFTAWALKELKAAHKRGEKMSLKDIVSQSRSTETTTNKACRKKFPRSGNTTAPPTETPQSKESL